MTELLVVMVIMGITITAVATLFVSGSNAEVQLNQRFQAQTEARTALDTFRREIHNACAATVTATSVSLTVLDTTTSGYPCNVASATWCTAGSGSRYGLHRAASGTCSASSPRRADYLTSGSIFSLTTTAGFLPRVGIDMKVNVKPTAGHLAFRLDDAIALLNARRA